MTNENVSCMIKSGFGIAEQRHDTGGEIIESGKETVSAAADGLHAAVHAADGGIRFRQRLSEDRHAGQRPKVFFGRLSAGCFVLRGQETIATGQQQPPKK